MLNIRMNFDDDFVALYNSFNNTDKGKEYLRLTGIQRLNLDIPEMTNKFFNGHVADISINPNSSVGNSKNNITFSNEIVSAWYKLINFYMLWKQMRDDWGLEEANDLMKKIIIGTFYIHDATKLLVPYCFAASTSILMTEGRPYGPLHSKPPTRLRSFIGQVTEFAMDLSQEFAGAIALGDFLVNVSWYIDNEKLTEKQIENEIQSLIHVLSNPFRIGGDPVFSNISIFDEPNLKNLFKNYNYPDGSTPIDHMDTIKKVQKIFMGFMAKKDPVTNLPYRFPVTTANIFIDKDGKVEDEDFLNMVSEFNREGLFNIYITNDTAKLASCCRLQSSITDLMKFKGMDSFGNGGLNVGSSRVVTLNFYRICRRFKGDNNGEFKRYLSEYLEKMVRILRSHRNLLEKMVDSGFLKFFKLGWINLDKMFFSTIGMIGLYEGFKELDISTINLLDLEKVKGTLRYINHELEELSTKYQMPLNTEQIPGESASIKIAKKDKLYFNDEEQRYLLLSNQFVPLTHDLDLYDRATIDGQLDKEFSGGLISHLNISSKVTKAQMKKLIHFAIEKGLSHFALNPVYSTCDSCGSAAFGKVTNCSECGSDKISYLTRVVGYFVPVSGWSKERREWEFNERKWSELK